MERLVKKVTWGQLELLVTEEPQGHQDDLEHRVRLDHLAPLVCQDSQVSMESRAHVALQVNLVLQVYQEDQDYQGVTACLE